MKKCPKCGKGKHLLIIREEKVLKCENCGYSSCPECGNKLNDIIGYIRGNKTSDGLKCTKCDWEIYW